MHNLDNKKKGRKEIDKKNIVKKLDVRNFILGIIIFNILYFLFLYPFIDMNFRKIIIAQVGLFIYQFIIYIAFPLLIIFISFLYNSLKEISQLKISIFFYSTLIIVSLIGLWNISYDWYLSTPITDEAQREKLTGLPFIDIFVLIGSVLYNAWCYFGWILLLVLASVIIFFLLILINKLRKIKKLI